MGIFCTIFCNSPVSLKYLKNNFFFFFKVQVHPDNDTYLSKAGAWEFSIQKSLGTALDLSIRENPREKHCWGPAEFEGSLAKPAVDGR